MARKSNSPQKTTPLRLWIAKEQNASRLFLAPSYIMLKLWITSCLLDLVPLDHSRLPPHNESMKTSIKFFITAPLTPHMTLSMDIATCYSVHILTQGSTMRARGTSELEPIFSSLKMTTCPVGTDPC